jgi:hypothetical protein
MHILRLGMQAGFVSLYAYIPWYTLGVDNQTRMPCLSYLFEKFNVLFFLRTQIWPLTITWTSMLSNCVSIATPPTAIFSPFQIWHKSTWYPMLRLYLISPQNIPQIYRINFFCFPNGRLHQHNTATLRLHSVKTRQNMPRINRFWPFCSSFDLFVTSLKRTSALHSQI